MVSSANATLADGFTSVLVIAPLPRGHGRVPSVADDVRALARSTTVELMVPDQRSVEAIGPNIYDPERRSAAATAGKDQGLAIAARIAARWM